MSHTEGMTLTGYRDKHVRVQTLRRNTDWFFNLCDCKAVVPMPTIDDSKTDQHAQECPYRKRIEQVTE